MTEKTTPTKKESKKYLKTLTKDRGSRIRSKKRVIKYGTIGFGRNIWLSLASTLVMTITLLILFATFFANIILTETANSIKDKIDITVFINPGTPKEDLEKLSAILKKNENVKDNSVVLATSEDELDLEIQEASKKGNSELVEFLNDEDSKKVALSKMPATIRFKVFDPNNLDSIKKIIEEDESFKENINEEEVSKPTYDMNQAEIATISSWARIAKNGGLILGSVFLAISVLIIFNTIRMAIFSRREEIYMMKLIGADRSFIRGPFLVEARISGLISGIISSAISYLGFEYIRPTLESYGINISRFANLFNSVWVAAFFGIMILVGVLIGSISARLALKKYLRKL